VNPTTGGACDTCLNMAIGTGGSCEAQVTDACMGDPDCVALFKVGGCIDGCATKSDGGMPADDAGADTMCFNAGGTFDACLTCCQNAHPMGERTVTQAILACACCP
jgi:hypothetical protein